MAAVDIQAITSGGKLQPKQVQTFEERLILQSKLLQMCNVIPMTTPEWELDRAGFLGQVLHPDTELASPTESQIAAPSFDKRTLSVKRTKAVVKVGYHTLKSVIDRGKFVPFLTDELAKAVRRDMEKVIIRGDTNLTPNTAENQLLSLMDGVIAQSSAHLYDANGDPITDPLIDEMEILLPDQYADDPGLMVLTSRKAAIRYRQSRGQRATPGGDAQLAKRDPMDHHEIPVVGIPLFPSDLGSNTNQTIAMLCNPQNIYVGIQDDMEIELDRKPVQGIVYIVFRYAFDVTFKEPDAVVKATEVQAAA
jgi:HK97 family phage major capsid protein